MGVTIEKESMVEFATIVAQAVVEALETKNIIGNTINTINNNVVGGTANANVKTEKTAYQKTEQLLYNFRGFQKIIQERMDEIEEIKKYGVPQSCGAVTERVQGGTLPGGIVLPEESVESAIKRIEKSMSTVISTVNLIERCLKEIENDPYYKIIPLRYFNGCTLEDIGSQLNCDTGTVSRNKNRLIKDLALRMFPIQVIEEYMN